MSPPPGGGGEIKGFGDVEGKGRGKKEKKRWFGENIIFDSTKSSNLISETKFNSI